MGPTYAESDQVDAHWAESTDGLPGLDAALHSTDADGVAWITLHGLFRWAEPDVEDRGRYDAQRRDLWGYLFTWLVRPNDLNQVQQYLSTRSFMGRWMPEGRDITDTGYLGELPVHASAQEYPLEWEPVNKHDEDDAPSVSAYPAWDGYHWEGHILDCSIEESVFARMPAAMLFEAGQLRWLPGSRSWTDPTGQVVAQHRETADDHAALLVRADWLDRVLSKLVAGFFGEKQLIGAGWSPELVGGWTEHNALGVLQGGQWTLMPPRTEVKHPAS